jgi:hypothetical protein
VLPPAYSSLFRHPAVHANTVPVNRREGAVTRSLPVLPEARSLLRAHQRRAKRRIMPPPRVITAR